MEAVALALSDLEIGQPSSFGNLVMFPLIGSDQALNEYMTLDQSVEAGWARVKEVDDRGRVNQLIFENRGRHPVLLLDGEELVGAKQNRIVNLTVMAPRGSQITIPVSCVEKNRWGYGYGDERREFTTSRATHFAEGRANKAQRVTVSMRHDSYSADQGSIWNEVSEKLDSMNVSAASLACTDIADQYAQDIDEYTDALYAAPQQRGAVFVVGEKFVGLELFDRHDTLSRLLPKLVRSYAVDSIDSHTEEKVADSQAVAQDFLKDVRESKVNVYEALGEGNDVRFESAGIDGGALVCDGVVVQLSAFRNARRTRAAHRPTHSELNTVGPIASRNSMTRYPEPADEVAEAAEDFWNEVDSHGSNAEMEPVEKSDSWAKRLFSRIKLRGDHAGRTGTDDTDD